MSRSGLGPFIYTGSGKKQSADADVCQRECIKAACMIQTCLAKYQYNQNTCQPVIDAWSKCCDNAKAASTSSDDVTILTKTQQR